MRHADDTLSLRDLIAELLEAGKAYARAEIAYYKAFATARLTGASIAIGLIVAALLLLQAGLTVLFASLGLALARWAGPAGGLGIAALIALLLAGLLVWLGVRRLAGGAK